MWMLEDAQRTGKVHSDDLLVQAFLGANFAAIHTSTIVCPRLPPSLPANISTTARKTFTHALYHLAANPEYAEPLREEIERVVAEDGWTKASTARMWRLDSFLKESQRMNGVGARQLPSNSPLPALANSLPSRIRTQCRSRAAHNATSPSPTAPSYPRGRSSRAPSTLRTSMEPTMLEQLCSTGSALRGCAWRTWSGVRVVVGTST